MDLNQDVTKRQRKNRTYRALSHGRVPPPPPPKKPFAPIPAATLAEKIALTNYKPPAAAPAPADMKEFAGEKMLSNAKSPQEPK